MTNLIRNHKTVAAVIVVAAVVLALGPWPSAWGNLTAHVDLAFGRYQLMAYGFPGTWRPQYARLLRERYSIEYRKLADCIVSDFLVSYADSYNAVSTAAAKRKFGHDIFEECAEDARKSWEQQRAVKAEPGSF